MSITPSSLISSEQNTASRHQPCSTEYRPRGQVEGMTGLSAFQPWIPLAPAPSGHFPKTCSSPGLMLLAHLLHRLCSRPIPSPTRPGAIARIAAVDLQILCRLLALTQVRLYSGWPSLRPLLIYTFRGKATIDLPHTMRVTV